MKRMTKLSLFVGTALAAVLLFSAIGADTSAAAPPNAATGGPTVTVTPNPVALGATSIVISGSGFRPNKYLVIDPTTFPGIGVTTDGTGAFSVNYSPWGNGYDRAGEYIVKVMKYKGQALVELATTRFTVCSASPCQ